MRSSFFVAMSADASHRAPKIPNCLGAFVYLCTPRADVCQKLVFVPSATKERDANNLQVWRRKTSLAFSSLVSSEKLKSSRAVWFAECSRRPWPSVYLYVWIGDDEARLWRTHVVSSWVREIKAPNQRHSTVFS